MFNRILPLTLVLSLFAAVTAPAQSVTFSVIPYPGNNLWTGAGGPDGAVHADLNGDGREDFISVNVASFNSGCAGAFAVTLSTGGGAYASPVCYTTPSGSGSLFAVGDFNGDGALDVLVADGSTTAYLFLNNKKGALHLDNTVTLQAEPSGIVAADVNHDGAIDVVYAVPNSSGNPQSVRVLFGENNGLFHEGPSSTFNMGMFAGQLYVGDFDGDGHGDLLVNGLGSVESEILYGDGTGRFTHGPDFGGFPGTFAIYAPADVKSNGTMAAIAIVPGSFGTGSNVVDIEYGHSNRTVTSQQIVLQNCAMDTSPPVIADFDGDGIKDLTVPEGSACGNDGEEGPYTLNFMRGNGNGTFQPELVIYSTIYQFADVRVLRATHNSRPDVTVTTFDDRPYYPLNPQQLLFINSTIGNFPPCPPLNFRATGINVCGPTATVVPSSPVHFSFAGSNQTPGRDMEIWIDGKKVNENRKNSFSYYDFANANLSLSNGQHTVSVFSVGWDDSLLLYQLPLTVGSTICAPPEQHGLRICAPLENGSVSSPVTAWAAGNAGEPITRMEVWVDGVKKYSTYGSNTLKTLIPLSSGMHQFGYYLVGIDGAKWKELRDVFVP